MSEASRRHWDRAQRYLTEGQLTAARIALETLLQREPGHAQALLVLCRLALQEGRVRDASAYGIKAKLHQPADGSCAIAIAEVLLRAGETVAARECVDWRERIAGSDATTLSDIASLRKMLGQHPEALATYEGAAAAGMSSSDFRFQYALELIFNGHNEDAEAQLRTCLEQVPGFGRAALAIARLRKQTAQHNHIGEWSERLKQAAHATEDQASFHFALYKEYEDIGQHDQAWLALISGNAILHAKYRHQPGYARQLFEHLMQRCTTALLKPEPSLHDGPQPIFIVGMPRSGTTLLDRVLGNHTNVVSAGELDDFGLQLRWIADHRITLDDLVIERLPWLDYVELGKRYLERTQWRANGKRYYVDKLPRNWMVAGLIRRALPQAKILHLVRDPMDVCFSNFRALLGEQFPWSYDQVSLAEHYLQYRRVMAHWHAVMPGQILDVPYDALVRDAESVTRKVLAFCDLPWEPGCVDITRNKAAVATLSMSQVREGIHARFFEEWRPYETHLGTLRDALTAC